MPILHDPIQAAIDAAIDAAAACTRALLQVRVLLVVAVVVVVRLRQHVVHHLTGGGQPIEDGRHARNYVLGLAVIRSLRRVRVVLVGAQARVRVLM